MKKEVIIMGISMEVGGTEKALLNYLNEFDPSEYNITLLLLQAKGQLMKMLPSNISIKELTEYRNEIRYYHNSFKKNLLYLWDKKDYRSLLRYTSNKVIQKIANNNLYILEQVAGNLGKELKKYNIAVAFAGPMDFITYYVLKKINADKKIQFIHFDIDHIQFNRYLVQTLYPDFDEIKIVSKQGKHKFEKKFPELSNITKLWNTTINVTDLKKQALEGGFHDKFKGIRILTVGRLTYEKGQDIALQLLYKLIYQQNLPVKWYFVGDGEEKVKLKEMAKTLQLEEHIEFLGTQLNPYPYFNDCDVYIQLSRHEGYCITLAEAITFEKPIITTDFTGSKEQLINYPNSLILNKDDDMVTQVSQFVSEVLIKKQYSVS
nr:glycosyltransferase [Jeotgalibacillus malaysiensis]